MSIFKTPIRLVVRRGPKLLAPIDMLIYLLGPPIVYRPRDGVEEDIEAAKRRGK